MTKKLLTLFTLLTLSIGVGWAGETVHYELDGTQTGGNNAYADESEITQNNMVWMVTGNTTTNPWRIGGKSLTNVNREIYSKTAMSSAITSVNLSVGAASSITVNSLKLSVYSDAAMTTQIDEVSKSFVANSTINFKPSSDDEWATGSYYKITFNVTVSSDKNKYVEFNSATFYKNSASADIVLPPTFSPDPGSVVNSTTPITLTAEDGATIYYTTDESDPISSSTRSEYMDPIYITQTTTIKAYALSVNNKASEVVTATYTVESTPIGDTETATFVFTNGGNSVEPNTGDALTTKVQNGVTLTWGGTTPKWYSGGQGSARMYNGSTLSISAGSNKIRTIEFTYDSGTFSQSCFDAGTYNSNTNTLTCNASTINISTTIQVQIRTITVTYESTSTPSPYYLVGSFNDWTAGDEDYMFFENNGTYTLTLKEEDKLPACQFKIVKVENNNQTWYGFSSGEANIHHNNHENIPTGGLGSEAAFNLQSEGDTEFSFTLDASNYNNPKFTVTRTPKLSIQGIDDFDTNVEMAKTSTGWTISKTISQGQEFRFVDEFGQWQGWNDGNYFINGIDGSIPIKPGQNVFVMNLSGDFVLNVNEDVTALNITEVDLNKVYKLVKSEDDLKANGEYIIAGGPANQPYTVLMGDISSGNYGNKVDNGFTYDADAETMTLDDGCAAQVLALGGSAGAWTFYTGTKYLSLTNSSNSLYTSDNADNNAKWIIDVSKMPLSNKLIANKQYDGRYIEYNSSSPRFACYEGTQQAVALFKKVAQSNKSDMPTITPGSGNVYGLSQLVEITQANDGAAIYYTVTNTTNGETPTTPTVSETLLYEGPFTITATQFGQKFTVTAIAKEDGKEASHSVSATYMFIAPKKWTLAQIEAPNNPTGATYIVKEPLQVVYIDTDKEFAIARDMGENSSIAAVYCPDGATDFMRDVVHNVNDHQNGPWQQNNWVMLDFTDENANVTDVKKNGIIQGESLTGVYTDKDNYTIKVSGRLTQQCVDGDEYEPNVYSPANFHSSNTQTIGGTTYWFMTPKVMEVCKFTWAMYYNDPTNGYPAGLYMQDGEVPLKGGVGIDLSYNSASPTLVNGESYRFNGVIMKAVSGKKDPNTNPEDHYPQDGSTLNTNFKVAATNLTKAEGQVITAVSEVKTGGKVVSVTYCDLAGRMSQKPFAGVNIIVTRYSDGTVKTTKAIK